MSNNKFESLLELLINEENDKAEALFHEIVVEKSRDIYEGLAEEPVKEETKDEVKETEASAEDKVEEKPPEKGCSFQGRCSRIIGDKCKNETPPWQIGDNGNAIRCHINIKDLEKKQNGN